jgi:hypothetical protein
MASWRRRAQCLQKGADLCVWDASLGVCGVPCGAGGDSDSGAGRSSDCRIRFAVGLRQTEILGQLGDLFIGTIDVSISISAASIPEGLPVGTVQFLGGERTDGEINLDLGGAFRPELAAEWPRGDAGIAHRGQRSYCIAGDSGRRQQPVGESSVVGGAGLADQASSAEVATWAERAAWADTVDGYHYSDLAGIFVNE